MSSETLFGKFAIHSCLKKDEHSSVYLAAELAGGQRVIVKTLDTTNLPDPTVLTRFLREARILTGLKHPNIISVRDVGRSDPHVYISFEYVEGINLRQALREDKLDDERRRRLIRQMLQGLEYAHLHQVIHRDIKPENLLVNERDELKIADFGLALLMNEDSLTHKSSIVGTPGYMSPEQIRGEDLTAASDLFSAGIVVYELFTGSNPFLAGDVGQTINRILQADAPRLIAAAEQLPADIADLCLQLLQRDRRNRPMGAPQALERLSATEEAESLRLPFSRLRSWILLTLLAVLAGAVWLWQTQRPAGAILPDVASVADSNATAGSLAASPPDSLALLTVETSSTRTDSIARERPVVSSQVARLSPALDPEGSRIGTTGSDTTAKNAASANNLRGMLDIRCLPWADIYIDNQKIDTTPLENPLSLPPGSYQLRLQHSYFPAYQRAITLAAGEIATIAVDLDTLYGYLDCRVYPWGKVYLDDIIIGDTPFSRPIPLNPGSYRLRIINPQYPDYLAAIRIARGDTLLQKLNFESDR